MHACVLVSAHQNQIEQLKQTLSNHGWNGEGDIFELETLYAHGLQFSSEWISLYNDVINFHCMSETEIMVIYLICIGTAVIFFGLGIIPFLMKEKMEECERYLHSSTEIHFFTYFSPFLSAVLADLDGNEL